MPGYARAPFSPNFSWAFVRMDPVNVFAKFTVRYTLPVPARSWDNSDCSFGFGLHANPQSWGRGGRRGSGMVPFERALVISDMPSIVTFHPSLRVYATFPHSASSLHKISPCSPAGSIGGWPLGYEERRCWDNCRAINFQDLKRMWSWSTNVTDRRTDGPEVSMMDTSGPSVRLSVTLSPWVGLTHGLGR